MEPKPGRPEAPVKPVRRSLKAIESNIVNRRTQMFETSPAEAPKPAKVLPPQRPAPPKFTNRPRSTEIPNVNRDIAREFADKVSHRKSMFDDSELSSTGQSEVTKDDHPKSPQRLPIKPKPPKPETKPKLPGAEKEKSTVSDSVSQDSPVPSVASRAKQFTVPEESTKPKPVGMPVPKPRTGHSGSSSHEEKKDIPMYTAVDKSKKTQKKSTSSEDKSEDDTHAKDGASFVPPLKPPRTFEHDEYLKRKSKKKALKHKSSHVSFARQAHDISDGLTEEPEESANGDDVFQGLRFSHGNNTASTNQDSSHLYEEVGDPNHIYEEVGNRLSGEGVKPDRPNPPPRPPVPKSGTLTRTKPVTAAKPINKTHISDPGAIIKKKSLSNPGYEKEHDIIPIRTVFYDQNGSNLKRAHSDECLYDSKLNLNESQDSDEEPLYQDPIDVVRRPNRPHVNKGVVIDAEGYAIPHTGRHTLGRHLSHTVGRKRGSRLTRTLATTSFRKRGPSVRNKVSEAYSILRRNPAAQDGGASKMEAVDEQEEDSDVDMEEHKKKLEHIYSIKGKHYAAFKWTYSTPAEIRPRQLYDLGLIVGVEKDPSTNKYKPTVIFSFPENAVHKPDAVADFCFPDAASIRPVTRFGSETYSFILTSIDGTKHFGYCRRFLPPGSGNRLPEVCCVVSPFGSFAFYKQLVEKMEQKRKESLDNCKSLIQAAYGRPLPAPGREAWVRCHGAENDKEETVILKRPADCKLDRVSFSNLTDHLSVDMLIKVFSAMVLERRLLFTAQYLSTLSDCIHAISALLYPFEWHHTYIPVLPRNMVEVVCAPTPYIIGLLSTSLPDIQDLPMEEVLIIDLDNNHLRRSQGDESKILPKKLQKALASALKGDAEVGGSKESMVFEAFLRLFVETIGHYTEYICTQQDGKSVFEKELFCKAVSSKSIRLFLEWFTETQMFEEFIIHKVEDDKSHTTDTFDRRVMEYRDEMKDVENTLRQNVKQLGRRMINFVMESGGKIKKAFSTDSNVYV